MKPDTMMCSCPGSIDRFKQLCSESAAFFDPSGLSFGAAQVEQFGPAYLAKANDLELVDIGRVLREDPLHPDTVRHFTHGEGLGHAGPAFLDHDALKHLDALFAAFFYFIMDLHGIADAVLGKVGSDLVSANCVQNIHGSSHICSRKLPGPK